MNLKDFVRQRLADNETARDLSHQGYQDQYQEMLSQQLIMKNSLRVATVKEYADWLKVRYEKFKDANINTANGFYDFWIAASDLTVYPLVGALSMDIIIPKGITVLYPDGIGHNKLYFYDGSTTPDDATIYISGDLLKYL